MKDERFLDGLVELIEGVNTSGLLGFSNNRAAESIEKAINATQVRFPSTRRMQDILPDEFYVFTDKNGFTYENDNFRVKVKYAGNKGYSVGNLNEVIDYMLSANKGRKVKGMKQLGADAAYAIFYDEAAKATAGKKLRESGFKPWPYSGIRIKHYGFLKFYRYRVPHASP